MSARRFDVYAPVIIPTLCRYEHFKRCIDSLSKCTGAEYTDVYIGIDYPTKEEHWDGYQKICDYIKTVTGFNNVFIFLRNHNYGVEANIKDLKERVKKQYDRFVLTEDDNEFSPNFLEFINGGLEKYKDDPDVLKICGCLMPWDADIEGCLKSYSNNAFPAKDYNALGVGGWFSKTLKNPYTKDSILKSYYLTFKTFRIGYWQSINRFLYQLHKKSQLPDVCLRLYCAFNKKYCIFPRISKVKNWGYDGSGLNSDNNPHWIDVVTLDTASTFEYDDFKIKDYKEVKRFVKQMYGIVGWKKKLAVIKTYLFYRVTGSRIEDIPEGQRIRKVFFKHLFLNLR